MVSIIFVSWLVFICSLLVLNFGNITLIIVIRNRFKHKRWSGDDTAFLILGVVFVPVGILLYNISPDTETRIKMFYESKPSCQEETIQCLTKKANWYKDSIEYKIPARKLEDTVKIDSLKNIIKQYEK
jgi:hypothetical protein